MKSIESQADFARAEHLNKGCFCIGLDEAALRSALEREFRSPGLYELIRERCPHLFSARPVFVSESHLGRMAAVVQAVEHVVALPAYRDEVLARAGDRASRPRRRARRVLRLRLSPGRRPARTHRDQHERRRREILVQKVARLRVPVLLTGESGVGKEVAAQLIHNLGDIDSKGQFVAVNCAAIPETMMEAEFFGYEKGAFSGAQRAHRGYLERAGGGTLFLDEVADLPASMQAKLLRALQERCFFRLGAETTTRSDFRIVAATNRDLQADMAAGLFREDLFYRLAVIKINLPPLRERPEDVRWLTERMLRQIAEQQGRPVAMSEAFLRDVLGRNWKGNARELRSYLEETVFLSEAAILDAPRNDPRASLPVDRRYAADKAFEPLQAVVEETERAHIVRALERTGGSVSKTAALLGISRKTLWEKMRKLELSTAPPDGELSSAASK